MLTAGRLACALSKNTLGLAKAASKCSKKKREAPEKVDCQNSERNALIYIQSSCASAHTAFYPFTALFCPFTALYCPLLPSTAFCFLLLPFTTSFYYPFTVLYCPYCPSTAVHCLLLPYCRLLPFTALYYPLLPFYCPLLHFTARYCLLLPSTAFCCVLLPFPFTAPAFPLNPRPFNP